MSEPYKTATFAAGCFWGVEARFRDTQGVLDAEVGYTAGHKDNPTYQEVCTGTTNHAEAVRVVYDPSVVSFDELLKVFFTMHDPTTLNRQGPDVGTQYRSAIYYHDDDQKDLARQTIDYLNQENTFKAPVVTQLEEAQTFYRAEEYHQRYFDKMGRRGGCHI